ncbi:MAG: hypothetical protein IJ193_08145 [Bacilli bacterium]|nr:hypothetical protein [Bacilli bacterium]
MEIISEVTKAVAIEVDTTLKFKSKIELEFLRKIITISRYDISNVYLINPIDNNSTIRICDWDLITYDTTNEKSFKSGLKSRHVDLRKKYNWKIEFENEREFMDIYMYYDTKSNTIRIKGKCIADDYTDLIEKLTELDNGEWKIWISCMVFIILPILFIMEHINLNVL